MKKEVETITEKEKDFRHKLIKLCINEYPKICDLDADQTIIVLRALSTITGSVLSNVLIRAKPEYPEALKHVTQNIHDSAEFALQAFEKRIDEDDSKPPSTLH